MTYTAPQPIGAPDWFPEGVFSGLAVVNFPWSTTSAVNTGYVYVGAAPSVTVYANHSTVTQCNLSFQWFTGTGVGQLFVGSTEVFFDAQCAYTEILPVIAPWLRVSIVSILGATSSGNVVVSLGQEGSKQNPGNNFGSTCLKLPGTAVPNGGVSNYYGNFLTSGFYQFFFRNVTALTGYFQFYQADGTTSPPLLVFDANPAAGFVAYGQLVIGDGQPVLQVNNTGAGAVTCYAALVGPV